VYIPHALVNSDMLTLVLASVAAAIKRPASIDREPREARVNLNWGFGSLQCCAALDFEKVRAVAGFSPVRAVGYT